MAETREARAERELRLLHEDLYRLWLRYGTEEMPKLVRAAPYRFWRWRAYILDHWRRYGRSDLLEQSHGDRFIFSMAMGEITMVRDWTLDGEQYVIDWVSSWEDRHPFAPAARPMTVVEELWGDENMPGTVGYRISRGSQTQLLRIAEEVVDRMDARARASFINARVQQIVHRMIQEEEFRGGYRVPELRRTDGAPA